jgi:(E)-4-hydroxy-3-methylbut-2-enyl-diphosphate synthase
VKSAVGIGSLLLDGIGDTIRVSLTEAPEIEIPVSKEIVNHQNQVFANSLHLDNCIDIRPNKYAYSQLNSNTIGSIGGYNVPIVVSSNSNNLADFEMQLQSVIVEKKTLNSYMIYSLQEYVSKSITENCVVELTTNDINNLQQVTFPTNVIVLFSYSGLHVTYWVRRLYAELVNQTTQPPVIVKLTYDCKSFETMQIVASMDLGSVLIDGFCNGVMLENQNFEQKKLVDLSFAILQASRSRFTKTEFISCPSCGRTLFNIEAALKDVKERTNHLKGLKIAVMGCVVNGPGEMADADYGYVGAGKGTVNLYRKQELVKKAIPEADAVQSLIDLIKDNGDWK